MKFDWLEKAERHLAAGHQRGAFNEFRTAFYNQSKVGGGGKEILARGQRMRPKVSARYEKKWDDLLARLEAQVGKPGIQQPASHAESSSVGVVANPAPATGAASTPGMVGIGSVPTSAPVPHRRAAMAAVEVTGHAMKTCPDCAEEVREQARKCRYCGYEFAKACPECAENVRPEATKCRHCGHRFSPPNADVDAA